MEPLPKLTTEQVAYLTLNLRAKVERLKGMLAESRDALALAVTWMKLGDKASEGRCSKNHLFHSDLERCVAVINEINNALINKSAIQINNETKG